MCLDQGGIVTALKTKPLSITETCFQHHGTGRSPGLKIRFPQGGVGSSPAFGTTTRGEVGDRDGVPGTPNVPIGCKYSLVAETGLASNDRRYAFVQNATVRPGESADVGEIRLGKVD